MSESVLYCLASKLADHGLCVPEDLRRQLSGAQGPPARRMLSILLRPLKTAVHPPRWRQARSSLGTKYCGKLRLTDTLALIAFPFVAVQNALF